MVIESCSVIITSVSNKLIVRVGCGKGQRIVACHVFSLVCSAPHQEKHTLKTHSHHTLAHKLSEGNIRIGRVSIGRPGGWEGSGQAQAHLRGISGSSAQTGQVYETAAYEAWAYTNLLT